MTKEKFKTAGKTLNQQGWKNTSSYFLYELEGNDYYYTKEVLEVR